MKSVRQLYLHLLPVFALFMFMSAATQAHWQLNNAQSQLNFLSIKAGNVAEIHQFKRLSGSVSDTGEIELNIEIASIDTLIPIRDERLLDIMFEAEAFPTAQFTGAIDAEALAALKVGASQVVEVSGQLTVRDETVAVSATLLATRTGNRSLLVHTLKPVLLDAGSFGLARAVEELREIAGLPSISLSVPVTFTLAFSG